ncbi:hypothetical protein DFH06DRAFT_1143029 [Mycena polygramma]|nr:hypothetical protein DFH06DRAFT_1143029 [Mycena polygramma]
MARETVLPRNGGRQEEARLSTSASLRCEVSAIHVQTLHNSRSHWKAVCAFMKGRTFTVLRCIWKVQDFETQLKTSLGLQLLKEKPSHVALANVSSIKADTQFARSIGGD